jgi:hypothetical protein
MVEGVNGMTEWLYMTPPGGGDPHKFPAGDGVQAFWEARGYTVTDEPEEQPFVPPKVVQATPEDEAWVILYHPGIGASHEFPNHPDAIRGAYEAGWQGSPPKASPDPADEPPAKKAASKKASTEPAAATDESKE